MKPVSRGLGEGASVSENSIGVGLNLIADGSETRRILGGLEQTEKRALKMPMSAREMSEAFVLPLDWYGGREGFVGLGRWKQHETGAEGGREGGEHSEGLDLAPRRLNVTTSRSRSYTYSHTHTLQELGESVFNDRGHL